MDFLRKWQKAEGRRSKVPPFAFCFLPSTFCSRGFHFRKRSNPVAYNPVAYASLYVFSMGIPTALPHSVHEPS